MLDKLYGLAIHIRNTWYNRSFFHSYSSSLPVISIGNLTTGGTGKSPFVQKITRHYLENGLRTAVVGRGYGRKSKGFHLVSDGSKIQCSVEESGDELYMHAFALKKSVIIADEQRSRAVQWLEKNNTADIVILDDGFQHRQIQRDVNIVLIDQSTFREKLLPYGHLREPLSEVRRADILCFSHRCSSEQIQNFLKENVPSHKPYFVYQQVFSRYRIAWSESQIHVDNISAFTISSIAHPDRFHKTIEENGITIKQSFSFKDHYSFREKDISTLISSHLVPGSYLIITAKDEGKLMRFREIFSNNSVNCIVAEITISLSDEVSFFQEIDALIKDKTNDNSIKQSIR